MLEFPTLEQLLVLKCNKGWWHPERVNSEGKVSIVVEPRRSGHFVDTSTRIKAILDQNFPERRITVRNGNAVRDATY
jgi:hypothetical protein